MCLSLQMQVPMSSSSEETAKNDSHSTCSTDAGSRLNARKLSFYKVEFRLFFSESGVISQRARAGTSCQSFMRAATA